jgi:hypothetical protein
MSALSGRALTPPTPSSTTPGSNRQRRVYFGEHPSGRLGEVRGCLSYRHFAIMGFTLSSMEVPG